MQNVCKKYSDQTSVNLMSPSVVSYLSKWNSSGSQVPQSSLSNAHSLDVDSPHRHCYKVKQLGQPVQEQDSSSTQSTGQSHHEMTTTEGGCNGAYGTREDHMKPVLSLGTPNFVFPASQIDYGQSFACIPYPYADPCFGGLVAPRGPQAVIHPQMVGIVPARVPLPLNLSEEEPIFVNAKQYHGIIKRREARAKLEAQNKLIKARKPYLHESRHLHALKRVRGSGGRFVNTKDQQKQQQSKPNLTADGRNILELGLPHYGENLSECNFQSETNELGVSTASCSEITELSNNDYMGRHDCTFSGYPYTSAFRH